MDPRRRARLLATVSIGVLVAIALVSLQRGFDEADQRRAVELLDAKAPGSGRTVREALQARAGGVPPDCAARVESSCAGTLELTCRAGPGGPYHFAVDLLRRRVAPLDAAAASVLEATQHPPPDGGSLPVHP